MMLWSQMRRPWWIAFVVTWLVVTVLLNNTGMSDTASVRIAALAAAAVAALTWLLMRALGRVQSGQCSEE